jgi:hypothetical protein
MSRALGWTLVILLVVMLGTHPGSVMTLLQDFLGVLHRAGDELSTFVNQL